MFCPHPKYIPFSLSYDVGFADFLGHESKFFPLAVLTFVGVVAKVMYTFVKSVTSIYTRLSCFVKTKGKQKKVRKEQLEKNDAPNVNYSWQNIMYSSRIVIVSMHSTFSMKIMKQHKPD